MISGCYNPAMIESPASLRIVLTTVLLFIAGQGSALAEQAIRDRLGECAAIAGSFKRLDCFDAMAREYGAEADGRDSGAAGKWLVEERNDGIGDASNVYMIVRAVEKIPGEKNPVRPILVVRCESGNTAVIFNFARFIDQSRAEATMRIDDGNLLAATLKMSASGKAFGFWQGEDAVPFAKRLIEGKRLFVQVTPFGAQPVVAEFPVEGFDAAATPLRKACGW
jgi:type VI secretion system protein VasI